MQKCKKKLKFVLINDKVYPYSKRHNNCPMPLVQILTFEMERTPAQVLSHMAKLDNNLGFSPLCWPDCKLECPAKQHVIEALNTFIDKK